MGHGGMGMGGGMGHGGNMGHGGMGMNQGNMGMGGNMGHGNMGGNMGMGGGNMGMNQGGMGMGGGNIQWSDQMGGNGGSPGQFIRDNLCLVGVRGRTGAAVDQLQFLFIDINTGQHCETQAWGGNGGRPFTYQAPQGQWIDKVTCNFSQYLNSIEF